VSIEGRRFVDGGLAEPVPFRTALGQGATHVLVLRTRRADQRAERPPRAHALAMGAWFSGFAPGAGDAYRRRHLLHAEDEARLDATGPELLQVRPPVGSPDVTRLTGDLSLVGQALEIGRQELLGTVGALGQR
jgi:predicted patatin/cPLA2 family phospholipase